jgi:hypothetical protein
LLGLPTEPRTIQEYHAEVMAEPMHGRPSFGQAAVSGAGTGPA